MSSSILDLSLSRGSSAAAADTSSGRAAGRGCSPATASTPLLAAELRVSTTEQSQTATATSPDDDSIEPEVATTAEVGSDDVIDDVRSRDSVGRVPPYPPYWTDYHAAAAARFLVPFLPSPGCAATPRNTGSSPMTPSLNLYPFPFPGMSLPPTSPETAGFNFRPDRGPARSRSTEHVGVKVHKEDCMGSDPMTSSPTGNSSADPTYAERRRKNNEAARRSRDARRMKERETCLRAALLQQENVRLRAEMAVLKTEVARLHCLLYEKI